MQFIYALAFYLPLEEFILKWLPVSDQTHLMLRQLPDLIVFLMFITLLFQRLSAGRGIPQIGRGCDSLLFYFLAWTVVSLLLNDANIPIVIANLKALLRYILLIYIVLMLAPSETQTKRLMRWIGYAVVLQIALGIFQFAGGIATRDFLAARHVSEDVAGITAGFTGDRFEGVNDLMGTMGNTIAYAMFLLVGMSILIVICKMRGFRFWLGYCVLFVSIYLSGSRSVVLVAIFLLLMNYGLVFGFVKLSQRLWLLLLLLLLLTPMIFISDFVINAEDNRSFSYIFTPEYIMEALNQRLGILVYICPQIGLSANSLIGFSPDKFVFIDFVRINLPMIPQILVDVLQDVLEDVYWVALFIYYGWIGLGLWVLFLIGVAKKIKFIRDQFLSLTLTYISTVTLLLLLATIPLNFLNQAFEVRGFSFYLWLMCGLTLASYRREKLKISGGYNTR